MEISTVLHLGFLDMETSTVLHLGFLDKETSTVLHLCFLDMETLQRVQRWSPRSLFQLRGLEGLSRFGSEILIFYISTHIWFRNMEISAVLHLCFPRHGNLYSSTFRFPRHGNLYSSTFMFHRYGNISTRPAMIPRSLFQLFYILAFPRYGNMSISPARSVKKSVSAVAGIWGFYHSASI